MSTGEGTSTTIQLPGRVGVGHIKSIRDRANELTVAYEAFPNRLTSAGLWSSSNVGRGISVVTFRDDSLFLWQRGYEAYDDRLREYATYVQSIDTQGLLGRLKEDGAFGARTARTVDSIAVSRDLLDSIVEIYAFERLAGLVSRTGLRILDIGAGYGRFAHRVIEAGLNIGAYWCVDGVPLSSAICEYYAAQRQLGSAVKILDALAARDSPHLRADVAVAIHSLSEMPLSAVEGWLEVASRAGVRDLLIVPNEPDSLQSMELDRSRRPLDAVIAHAGFERRDSLTLVPPEAFASGPVDRFGNPDVAILFSRD